MIVGGFVTYFVVALLRRFSQHNSDQPSFESLVVVTGAVERFIATTLVLFAPSYFAVFVGGWVSLKFAIGWQRRTMPKHIEKTIEASGIALIGNVVSFGIAIGAVLFFRPDAVALLADRQRLLPD